MSLPDFDGVLWKPSAEEGAVVEAGRLELSSDRAAERRLTEPVDDRASRPIWRRSLGADAVSRCTSIEVPGRTVRFNADTGTTFVDRPLEEGESYTVDGVDSLQPTAEDLRNVRSAAPLENGRYLYRSPATAAEVEDARATMDDGADNDFDKAFAIEEHLPDTSRVPVHGRHVLCAGGPHSILEFLTESKAGFCQQFSTAMAAMLRSVGVQSRVVVGFADGDRMRHDGAVLGQDGQRPRWVEVYFPGWGWMPFEPTPTRVNPVTNAYTAPPPECTGQTCPSPDAPATGGPAESVGGPAEPATGPHRGRPQARERPAGQLPSDRPPIGRRSTRRSEHEDARSCSAGRSRGSCPPASLPPARALRRRVRLRRAAAEPRRLILVTYEQFTERAAGLGLGRGAGETLEEYRRKVMETGYLSNGHLDRLTRLATAAAYSQHEPDGEQAEDAGDAAETAIREIRASRRARPWFVGLYRGRWGSASRGLARRGVRGSRTERPDEPLPVLLELANLRLHTRRDVVDRHEERHLPVPERVHHLTVTPADLEDRLPVGHELHLGQMLREPGLLRQELPRPTDPLERHPAVQQRLHDAERHEVAERIEPRHPRATAGALDRRLDEPDLVPVAELTWRATR